jgi:hypothetical protein
MFWTAKNMKLIVLWDIFRLQDPRSQKTAIFKIPCSEFVAGRKGVLTRFASKAPTTESSCHVD